MQQDILEATARLFDVPLPDLIGSSRAQHIVQARQAAAYALRRETPLSLAEIGKVLGRKDHTTIVHAVAAAERRAAHDTRYALKLGNLLNR